MTQQRWSTPGKIKMRNLQTAQEQTNSCTQNPTLSHFDLRRFWTARAAFDLRRTKRGFSPILQATLTFRILCDLITSDQLWLHLLITPCTFARDRPDDAHIHTTLFHPWISPSRSSLQIPIQVLALELVCPRVLLTPPQRNSCRDNSTRRPTRSTCSCSRKQH